MLLNDKTTLRPGFIWMCTLVLMLAACAAPAPARAPATPVLGTGVGTTPILLPTPVATGGSALATSAAGSSGANAPSPSQAGVTGPELGLTTVAGNLREPDDLALGPEGSIYITDVGDGTVSRIEAGGHVVVLVSGLHEPEGMVFLPGGGLIIAEQGLNRLVRYDPATHAIAPFLALENKTGQMGVDGIAFDGQTPDRPALIVPDSPNGTVLRVSLDGKQVQTIGHGFVRPVAAWVEPDGNILVADEFGNRLQRLHADGRAEVVATLPEPDDVIEDASGHIYVNSLADGAIHEIDAKTGVARILAAGLSSPQGIAFDTHGALLATDPGHHRVVRLRAP